MSGGVMLGLPSKRQQRRLERQEHRRTHTNPPMAQATEPFVDTPIRPGSSFSSSVYLPRRCASTIDLSTALPDDDVDVFHQNMQSTPDKPRSLGSLLAKKLFNINPDDSGYGFGLGRSKDTLRMPMHNHLQTNP
ncbi:hypothetical protein QCA50_010552 [Cerrena zonata]|uniref:Uncharacterized protein n=1 Tax=Cerrena zonata TaxID=2478898 RepID=A0AAW0G8M0_9APHY